MTSIISPYIFPGLKKSKKSGIMMRPKAWGGVQKDPHVMHRDRQKIIDAVVKFTELSLETILRAVRKRNVVNARKFLIWFLFKRTNMSKAAISEFFNKDHTTIIFSLNAMQDLLEGDQEIISQYEELDALIMEIK